MLKEFMKREVGITIVVLVFIFLLISWLSHGKRHDYIPPVIKGASVGLTFDQYGKLIFLDEKGGEVKSIPLQDQIKRKCASKKDWEIEEVTTITIYRVTGSRELWFNQGGESTCYLFSDDMRTYLGSCN